MILNNFRDLAIIPCGFLLPPDASEEQKKQIFEHYGTSNEQDTVELELSVASLVFDIYDATVELPKAPYNRSREKAHRQKMAEEFENSTAINLTPEVERAVRHALTDDNTWTKVKIGVHLKNQKTDVLGGGALELFPKAKNALLTLCED